MVSTHLIIVPCHGIWKGRNPRDRDNWHLAPFQIEGNDHICFIEHLSTAYLELEADPAAFMIISGGETKREAGEIAEATTYHQLLNDLSLIDSNKDTKTNKDLVGGEFKSIQSRIATEVYARDSFENVLFSMCRFYELHKRYPTKITITGFEFKSYRFTQLHLLQALAFNLDNVVYLGNQPNPSHLSTEAKQKYFKELDHSEKQHAANVFAQDWYGIGPNLKSKKLKRNPFAKKHSYAITNPYITNFLNEIADDVKEPKLNQEIKQILLQSAPWTIERITQSTQLHQE
ncbi:hypothetical protein LELG_01757 [Lodderomyces elongisporus NRRL YB-4239]|uniref:DUF218 domain-containing protein n=1 Tax=Lodderomyces elongisporus (strain ATCC 11503 / CBS 2605 / JCM 1781 / NBRC 1676 / NRRL YB-4239) TaxID=379508 RepID=A5DWM1_LODEL|nr:hypothetical protein LELG_01757 [Lodderomyces elongisporus NRRL YB-4239]